jgi:hypothetical protein
MGRELFARGRPEAGVPGPARQAGQGTSPAAALAGDLTALLRACLVALRVPAEMDAWQPARPALWQVADTVARIRQVLDTAPDGKGAELGGSCRASAQPHRSASCAARQRSPALSWLQWNWRGMGA